MSYSEMNYSRWNIQRWGIQEWAIQRWIVQDELAKMNVPKMNYSVTPPTTPRPGLDRGEFFGPENWEKINNRDLRKMLTKVCLWQASLTSLGIWIHSCILQLHPTSHKDLFELGGRKNSIVYLFFLIWDQ